jgi:aspergillopepsin I
MAILKYVSLAAVLLSSVAVAAPTPEASAQKAGRFTVGTVPVKVPKRNGTRALAKAFRKFNAPLPKILANAAGTETGTVAATPEEFDTEYLAPVSIGGQTLTLDFDTGSSDLWVFSSSLSASSRAGHTAFNPANSPTFETLAGERFSITFGDGSSAAGTVGTDTVRVGGVTVTGQAVELATTVSSSFVSDVDTDGLLGLGMSSINSVRPTQVNTFFENAIPALESPVFTADLRAGAVGSYDFGFIDDSKHTGTITYTAVNTRNGFWEFTATGFGVGNTFVSGTFDVIADTGTTLLLVPDEIINDYWGSVPGAVISEAEGGVIFPCSATLPSLTIGIGTARAVIPGEFLNFAPVSNTECFGGAQSSDGIGFSILGDVFLKSQFVVFDQGNVRFGVAPKA